MSDVARELYQQRKALMAELLQALGDDIPRKSPEWWHYFFMGVALGPERARQLVQEAHTVEARSGMKMKGGTRRRTHGGILFALAKAELGRRKAHSVRWRARRQFEELEARAAGVTMTFSTRPGRAPGGPPAAGSKQRQHAS